MFEQRRMFFDNYIITTMTQKRKYHIYTWSSYEESMKDDLVS